MNPNPTNNRQYPILPVPAVAGLIFSESNSIVLIQRGTPPAQGKWSLPGGVITLGEKPEEALKREIDEECGIQIQIESILTVVSRIIRDRTGRIQYHYIITDFICQYLSGDLTPGSDARDGGWFQPHQLESVDLTKGLMEVIETGLAKKST